MALSQKHFGKMLVPWFNSNEWKYVNDLIFAPHSTNVEKKQALKLLQMWKIRTPKLPSGVEGTLIILDALLQRDTLPDDKLRILYGASIMRFLNLCSSGDKQGTFYKTAKQNDLPDWLVNLRHDAAHDQIVPSMFMLRMGLEFCLDWLKHKYWEKQSATLKDFIINIQPKKDIKNLMELYCQINLMRHVQNVKYIQDIDNIDPTTNEKLNSFDIEGINGDAKMDIKYALKLILENIAENITHENGQQVAEKISEIIVATGSMLATAAHQFDNGKEELPQDFVAIWQDLINLLYFKNMLFPSFKKLLNLSISDEETEHTKKIASLWFAELCKCLLLAKIIYNKYNDIPDRDKLNKDTAATVLKEIVQKENPELKSRLILDFQYCISVIDDLKYLRSDVLNNPHIYTLNFLKYFLQLFANTQIYNNKLINEVETVVKKYVVPENLLEVHYQLHTIEEYNQMVGNNSSNSSDNDVFNIVKREDNVLPDITSNSNIVQTETNPQKRWNIVKDTSIFEGCPLGVLAHQIREANSLL